MIAYEVCASGAFFTALLADCFAHLIASTAFVLTFAMIVKTVAAVVTHFMIVIAGTAVAAVVLFITGSAGTLAAVIAIVTQPVIVAPATAVFALYAVFVCRADRCCNKGKQKPGGVAT